MSPRDDDLQALRDAALEKLAARYGGLENFRHPAWDTMPTYVLVPSLPAHVRLLVIRDPTSPTPRMIVFDEHTVTDDHLYDGVSRLAMDEERVRSTSHVRTLTMFDDGHYDVEADGEVSRYVVRSLAPGADGPSRGRGSESRRLLRETARRPLEDIAPGLRGRKFTPAAR